MLKLRMRRFVHHPYFHKFIIVVILINGVVLGLQTSSVIQTHYGNYLSFIDKTCLIIFIGELCLRIFADRGRFFKNGWNLFDLIIILISGVADISHMKVLMGFRIIRILHLISEFPILERVIQGMILSLPGVGAAITLLLIIFYMASVMATTYFGEQFPALFGTISTSLYTLFQVMTLESWSMGVVRPIMTVFPYAWAFFIPFILMTTYLILNLFVGIIAHAVNAVERKHHKKHREEHDLEDIIKRLDSIERCLRRRSKED